MFQVDEEIYVKTEVSKSLTSSPFYPRATKKRVWSFSARRQKVRTNNRKSWKFDESAELLRIHIIALIWFSGTWLRKRFQHLRTQSMCVCVCLHADMCEVNSFLYGCFVWNAAASGRNGAEERKSKKNSSSTFAKQKTLDFCAGSKLTTRNKKLLSCMIYSSPGFKCFRE